MPENANQVVQSAKKRKTNESGLSRDVFGLGILSVYRDSSDQLELGQQKHGRQTSDEKEDERFNIPGRVCKPQVNQAEQLFMQCDQSEKSLKDHMQSILSDVSEARENLFRWWRQEMQTILTKNEHRMVADKAKKQGMIDGSISEDRKNTKSVHKEGQPCERQDVDRVEPGEPQITISAKKVSGESKFFFNRNSEVLSPDPKPIIFDTTIDSGLEVTNNTANESGQVLQGSTPSDKAESNANIDVSAPNVTNTVPTRDRSATPDMCTGADVGHDAKGVEGLDGTLESGITVRESFRLTKFSHAVPKGLDGAERLHEARNALLETGFDDEESNEGNGLGCSLESAASSKVNSGLGKSTGDMQKCTNKGSDDSFTASLGENNKGYSSLSCGQQVIAIGTDAHGPTKVKKEIHFDEERHGVIQKSHVNIRKEDMSALNAREVDSMMGTKLGQASLKGGHIQRGSVIHINQPKDVQHHVSVSSGGCGIKRLGGTAMTFNGSALGFKNEDFQQGSSSHVDAFNSVTSSTLVSKGFIQSLAGDKEKVESLALPSERDSLGVRGGNVASWSMFGAPKNALDHASEDPNSAHLEYASRSKLGDAVLSSARTVDFPGFDPMANYASHFKGNDDIMNSYQQDQATSNSMYFSSLCTNNSAYPPTINRGISPQHFSSSTSPASSSGMWPMLMGMPGHVGGHHDASNLHMFLGLGMNGVAPVANGMQTFGGFYLQKNQQQNQAAFKSTPHSTSSMVSEQENTAVQGKGILELNF